MQKRRKERENRKYQEISAGSTDQLFFGSDQEEAEETEEKSWPIPQQQQQQQQRRREAQPDKGVLGKQIERSCFQAEGSMSEKAQLGRLSCRSL